MPLLRAIKCASIERERFPRVDSAGSVRSLNYCLGFFFALPLRCLLASRSRPALRCRASISLLLFSIIPLHCDLIVSHIGIVCVCVSIHIGVFLRQNFSGRARALFSSVFLVCSFIAHLEN
jgi:hypothetical protein